MLTWLDITLLVILGLSTLVGLWRGFLVEVSSIVVWVAAFWLAFTYGEQLAPLFEGHVEAPSARLMLGYALLFVLALIVGGLTTWLLGKLVKSTGLSGTDRLLGMLFGIARGALLGCVLVLLFGFTPMPGDDWWRQSRLLPYYESGAEWMRGWLPEQVAKHVDFSPADYLPSELSDGLLAPMGDRPQNTPLESGDDAGSEARDDTGSPDDAD
ncbi:MAG: CvpA family protein [Rhodanobacteraceae bacterium]|nr:CvpA family protein [Xanthomonadales bacterium]MCP5479150.1 CvpA family protein [Rhodanobacteraceae bacterium]HPF72164.1 CvpA family protein [Xanthomonadaceae bacterium]HRX99381.1 CvpA family protein [Xanthomonadaceae bacterium]